MKTHIQYNSTGGMRFKHDEPLKLGTYYTYMGERVKLVGPGMAGMPEVEFEDGHTCFAFPHDLKEHQ